MGLHLLSFFQNKMGHDWNTMRPRTHIYIDFLRALLRGTRPKCGAVYFINTLCNPIRADAFFLRLCNFEWENACECWIGKDVEENCSSSF
jgi:hypothetical protein